ncbi:unnamed protein product, partial [Adineta ricciae]
MKRTISSLNNNRDVDSSRAKRTRTTPAANEKENIVHTDDSDAISNHSTVLGKKPKRINEVPLNDKGSRNTDLGNASSTLSGSSITFSSTASRSASSAENPCTRAVRIPNRSSQLQLTTDSCVASNTNLEKKSSIEDKAKTKLASTSSNAIVTHRSSSQARSSITNKNSEIKTQNSIPYSMSNNQMETQRLSSSNNLSNSATNQFPSQALIEGSLEYRELKRLYVREQQQVEEWRKDYQVMKRQLADLKASSIPRPTAEAVEWLQEVFDLMNNNGVYQGDGRTLEKIGEDLGLDPANLITVAARTPQRSALKLFRLLFSTTGSRAALGSVKNIAQSTLHDIYAYVRTLHPNLTFHMNDMKNAIGTSIRSAKSELRRADRYLAQPLNASSNDEDVDLEDDNRTNEGFINISGPASHATDGFSEDESDDDIQHGAHGDVDGDEFDEQNEDAEEDDDEQTTYSHQRPDLATHLYMYFVNCLQISVMNNDHFSLRSAKTSIRRLRSAATRAARNSMLASLCPKDSNEVEMADDHNSELASRNEHLHNTMMQEHDEEEPICDPHSFDCLPDDSVPTDSPATKNDDPQNDDELLFDSSGHRITNIVTCQVPDTKDISTALALFRHRHNLSKSCINDLCDLLRFLGVKNVPADFRSVEKSVMCSQGDVLQSKKHILCSECGNKGTNSFKCETVSCKSSTGFASTPTTICTFKLLPQAIAILDRCNLMNEPDDDRSRVCDVQEGEVRRNIIDQERKNDPTKRIITFTLNSDGIVLKKFSRSVWISCMVINELPRSIRYDSNNIILCSVTMGGTKPKKQH